MKPYLEYVRSNPKYTSRFKESTLEWRDDVPDGLEISLYHGFSASNTYTPGNWSI
jgi:hypothetical protein